MPNCFISPRNPTPSTIIIRPNVRILRRRAPKLLKQPPKTKRLAPSRFQHVVPQPVCRHGVTLLAQVHTVDRHDRHVGLAVPPVKHAGVLEKRLIHHGEVIAVELGHVADAFHDLDKVAFQLAEQVPPVGVFRPEQAGTFDRAGQVAGKGKLGRLVHRERQVDEG